ncbi:hypothetical protein H0O02_03920, partial [Candidatus Micrarchaeota archaeon]|nr:hypothetical protein [Candidatus Micrarchaeota archaeon]
MPDTKSRQGIIAGTYAIKLGRTRIQHAGEDGKPVDYIMKHSDTSHAEVLGAQKKVHDLLKRKEKVAGEIKTQCRKAKEEMEKLALPENEGPYADVDGRLAHLAEVLGGENKFEIMEHVMDIIRPFDNDAETEANFPREYEYEDMKLFIDGNAIENTQGLITAGTILAEEEERKGESKISGARYTIITDYMEAVILAVGALRNLDIDAYPALAIALIQGQEVNSPVIAVLEPESENPLITFNLMRNHPPVAAVHIISDSAMLGATYA